MSTRLLGALAFVLVAGCGTDSATSSDDVPGGSVESLPIAPCDTAGLTLPAGYCATVYADHLGAARQLAVTPSGDVFAAIAPVPGAPSPGAVVAMRDADGDGVADFQETVLPYGGNGIAWAGGALYLAPDDRVMRYALADGALEPMEPTLVVGGLPATPGDAAKTVVPAGDRLYANAAACDGGGISSFDATRSNQTADAGVEVASGLRGATALAYDARAAQLWAAIDAGDGMQVVPVHGGEDFRGARGGAAAMTFATGEMFPLHYRTGVFLATGDAVVYVPFGDDGAPNAEPERLVTGFGDHVTAGVAVLPDGSLLVGDGTAGRIWRITYSGDGNEPL